MFYLNLVFIIYLHKNIIRQQQQRWSYIICLHNELCILKPTQVRCFSAGM